MMSKKMVFLLFNIGTITYAIWRGSLAWDVPSVIAGVVAMLLMNGVLWISARKFKDWKW